MIKIIILLAALCGLTCVLEIVPLLFLQNRKKWIKTSLICNLLTNPLLNTFLGLLTLFNLGNIPFIIITIILEVFVVVFEAFIYRNAIYESKRKCFFVSFIANLISFSAGLVISSLLETAI